LGVLAISGALPSTVSLCPQPSRIHKTTGLYLFNILTLKLVFFTIF
jgi:hypothetical protein